MQIVFPLAIGNPSLEIGRGKHIRKYAENDMYNDYYRSCGQESSSASKLDVFKVYAVKNYYQQLDISYTSVKIDEEESDVYSLSDNINYMSFSTCFVDISNKSTQHVIIQNTLHDIEFLPSGL